VIPVGFEFSIIIPVYNRPLEVDELLGSITKQSYSKAYEVIIVEDGSDQTSEDVVKKYQDQLKLQYYYKDNSGPGLSRNFGMQKASGNYFIIIDSDCILPKSYLEEVSNALSNNYTDAYGGPDASHFSFSSIQKAISYSMTSILTTGGIRGKKTTFNKFQPRSFNMGLSKEAFNKTRGFGSQNYGEDIDLTFRLWNNGFDTQLIEEAFVFHKRRIDWISFLKQTFNFGAARPILNKQHPNTSKITYWFPSFFITGFLISILLLSIDISVPVKLYSIYFLLIFVDALITGKSILVSFYSIWATFIQFLGYGSGFLRSTIRLQILQRSIRDAFPEMFR
jgi:glycosyltransferase involved in cell wall biosynthesis